MAEVTYYFNGYDTGEDWPSSPANMVDGNLANFASSNGSGQVQLCNSNTCGIDESWTITKVELRVYGRRLGGTAGDGIYLRPVFSGGDGDNHLYVLTTSNDWSSYFDITSDTNAPVTWSWTNIQDLDCDVESYRQATGLLYAAKVEIRVTYTGSSPSSSPSSSISSSISSSPSASISASPSTSPSSSASNTPSASVSSSPSSSISASASNTPSASVSSSPSASVSSSPSSSISSSPSASVSSSPSASVSSSISASASNTPSASLSSSPSASVSSSPSVSISSSPSQTPSTSISSSPSTSISTSVSSSPSSSVSSSPSASPSSSVSTSPSTSASSSVSASPSTSVSSSVSTSPSESPSASLSDSPSASPSISVSAEYDLSVEIQNQITRKNIKPRFFLTINNVDFSSYLANFNIQASKEYGVSSATFTLQNDGRFGHGGVSEIFVGDVVSLKCAYQDGDRLFDKFYGIVNQRTINKSATDRSITLTCLDYISKLKFTDINLDIEGEKIEVTEETLTPNYLPEPNETFSQIFNFANDGLAQDPSPIILIRNKYANVDDPWNDSNGYEIQYATGQLKLGAPINTENYDVICRSYYYYPEGVSIESAIEQLLTTADGYGLYTFDESSAQNVIDNHLIDTHYNVEKMTYDVLTPNYTDLTFSVKIALTADCTAGDTSITLEDTDVFPSSGSAEIAGDIFTWTGKSSTQLTGIPSSGTDALKFHSTGAKVTYEDTYSAGQIWTHKYNRIITDLTYADYHVNLGGVFRYLDKEKGRLILDAPISVAATVLCTTNYSFYTIQWTGVRINGIKFRERAVETRWDALQMLLKYLAPNQILMTRGDRRIWLKTLAQKTVADYNLTLVTSQTYMEDEDLYTRVKFYGKNINPSNIMFNEDVDFVTTGQSFKGLASAAELTYNGTTDGWHEFLSSVSDAGYITPDTIKPIIYLNGIAVSDSPQLVSLSPIKVSLKERTVTTTQSDKGGTDVTTSVYYSYTVYFPHQSIDPTAKIILYDSTGGTVKTISPYTSSMDYARGVWTVPGDNKNEDIESLSTASYYVFYGLNNISIDYDNVKFFVKSTMIPEPAYVLAEATFEYFTSLTSQHGIKYVIDGRYDTQVQTEFYSEPPSGYPYAILDLGAEYNVQAIDFIGGFFRPDDYRKFDVDMRLTVESSVDNVNYYDISKEMTNFSLVSGEAKSFEENDLGVDFSARYFLMNIENLGKLDYKNGIWPLAITEIAAYDNIVLSSEATLIRTTKLAQTFLNGTHSHFIVNTTEGFDEPDSGGVGTAYVYNGTSMDTFTYTGLTSTSFLNVIFDSGNVSDYAVGRRVSKSIETDVTVYDDNELLPKLGDRVYKQSFIDESVLFDQDRVNKLSKAYLQEFIKNHSRIQVSTLFAPYLEIGMTVYIQDTYNNIAQNYFIEQMNISGYNVNLVLARYE